MTARATGCRRRDCGSATVEFVVLAPLLMIVTLVVIGFGRAEQAHLTATGTAGAAARAASLERTPAAAVAAARAMAEADSGSCPRPEVSVDTASFHPGGLVKVTVVCRPRLADISTVGLPGSLRISATMVSGIDSWRATDGR